MKLDYERDVEINPDRLGQEIIKHPKLYLCYSQKHIEAVDRTKRLKEKIDVTYAMLDSDIRENPSKYGLSKTTEASIKNTIIIQDKYQDVLQEYNQAYYESETILVAIKAFEHRKQMLNNLTQLVIAEYFAKPKNPFDLTKINDKERKNLNRRRRNQC